MSELTYWYLNTNERGVPNDERIAIWFDRGLGFTFGEEFGPPLARLSKNDIVFLFRSGTGIIGIGSVLGSWDHQTYTGKSRMLEYSTDVEEYRIRIDWFSDCRDGPLSGNDVIGNTPSQFLESIVKPEFKARAEKLVAKFWRAEPDPNRTYKDGGRGTGQIVRRVNRNARLAKDKIASVPINKRCCECCGQRTQDTYPSEKVIYEVHHRKPFADDDQPRETKLADVAIVCPNCHVAITKLKKTVEQVRNLLKN